MRKSYIISPSPENYNLQEKKNAMSKAREDVEITFKSMGYETINITIPQSSSYILLTLKFIIQYLRLLRKLPRKSNVCIQYPITYPHLSYIFYSLLRFKQCRVINVVHDIECLRYNSRWKKTELKVLNATDILLVHTPSMKDKLQRLGVKVPMYVMELFDYYTSDAPKSTDSLLDCKKVIAFAGNLMKSVFITKLQQSIIPSDLIYRFYGLKGNWNDEANTQTEYCCAFSPNNVNVIQAGWGLVWDGDDIDSCTGVLGEYLRYNASHKASLYLASGMPLIVWNESALAHYVETNKIGISVSSLNELPMIISSISDEEYQILTKNVAVVSSRIRNGEFLKSIIKSFHNYYAADC